jgi:hypothetical protein
VIKSKQKQRRAEVGVAIQEQYVQRIVSQSRVSLKLSGSVLYIYTPFPHMTKTIRKVKFHIFKIGRHASEGERRKVVNMSVRNVAVQRAPKQPTSIDLELNPNKTLYLHPRTQNFNF